MTSPRNASSTKRAIMRATYRALCKHGSADLTMQAIADEFDKTKAVLHYHYDTKENLLVAFLEYLLDGFDPTVDGASDGAADAQLLAVLRALLGTVDRPASDDFDHDRLSIALLQIRAQAPYNDEFRRQLTVNVATVRELMADIIQAGIEAGEFRPVDPDETALTLLAAATGGRNYAVTIDDVGVEPAVERTLERMVHEWLGRPGAR